MRYRRGIDISNATERELIRWQMEKIIKESDSADYSLGEWSEALAKLNNSLENSYSGFLLRLTVCLYSIVGVSVLVIKFLRRE